MPSEWEIRKLEEEKAEEAAEKMRAPSPHFAVMIGLLMGFTAFFITVFSIPFMGIIAGWAFVLVVMNLSYLAVYPEVFKRVTAGDLWYIIVDLSFFVAGYAVGALTYFLLSLK